MLDCDNSRIESESPPASRGCAADQGQVVTWPERVTDEEYGSVS